MPRRLFALALLALVSASVQLSAQGRIKQQGRATVQYRSPEVSAVAAYEYSQRNHAGAWLLIEFAVQAVPRVAIHRNEFSLVGPDERVVPLATQQQFLDDYQVVSPLLQNALISRRPLDSYFSTRPAVSTLRFFAAPGSLVHDSVATNLDQVAKGDLLFKSPDGTWKAGTYRLVLNHEKVKAELPIELR